MALVNLHNPVGHLVQKVPVVRDGEDGSLKPVDIGLQPLHTLEVQVIGGLVQEENFCLLQQEPGQIHPGFLPAGEHIKFLLPHRLRNSQAVADLVRIHVHVIAASGCKAVAQPVILVQDVFGGAGSHLPLQLLHPPPHLHQLLEGRAKHLLHRVPGGIAGDLRDEAQLLVGVDIDLPLVISNLPGENAKQRGLAAAVAAQNGHTLALLHLKGQAVQQIVSNFKGLYQILHGNISHNVSPKSVPTDFPGAAFCRSQKIHASHRIQLLGCWRRGR